MNLDWTKFRSRKITTTNARNASWIKTNLTGNYFFRKWRHDLHLHNWNLRRLGHRSRVSQRPLFIEHFPLFPEDTSFYEPMVEVTNPDQDHEAAKNVDNCKHPQGLCIAGFHAQLKNSEPEDCAQAKQCDKSIPQIDFLTRPPCQATGGTLPL